MFSIENGKNHKEMSDAFGEVSGFLHKVERQSSLGKINALKQNDSDQDHYRDRHDMEQMKFQQDDKALLFLKCTVIIVLVVAGTIMAKATHLLATKEEQEVFQNKFDQAARSLIDVFENQVEKKMRVASMLSASFTSLAITINATWPFISLPDFRMRTMDAVALTKASAIQFSPLVSKISRPAWESYAGGSIRRKSGGRDLSQQEAGPFSPIFNVSSTSQSDLFFDQFSEVTYAKALSNMIKYKNPMMAEFTAENLPIETTNMLFVPIFNSFEKERKVVASLLFQSDWIDCFTGHKQAPVLVVVENLCGQQMSLTVSSEGVRFIGPGSLHESSFENMKAISEYLDLSMPWDALEAVDTEMLDPTADVPYKYGMNDEEDTSCRYRIIIYPTQDLRDETYTQRPAIYAFTVAMQLFFFAGIVFIVYDSMVRKRQDAMMEEAAKSSALVDSLFPAEVRDQVMESTRRDAMGSRSRLTTRRCSSDIQSTSEMGTDRRDTSLIDGPPIASYFPSTTIMFADIAGFTAWSSTREPDQVFTLLETLYGAFDAAAKRLGVFKVETIGDCYVAVVGLPQPKDDHAVIISRFAFECITTMNNLLQELEESLGPGTIGLGLRVGLHSGPVTAGVLRGDKSRFQLFGDSMNTTSRIESSGEKGKVHISESTATFIVAAGKQHWLTPRAELVTAKGKGQMQTFWLRPRPRRRARASQGINRVPLLFPQRAYTDRDRYPRRSSVSISTVPCHEAVVSSAAVVNMRRIMSTGTLPSPPMSKDLENKSSWGFIGNDHAVDVNRKEERLIESNAKLLHILLERVLAYRAQCGTQNDIGDTDANSYHGSSIISEVTEALPLAPFESTKAYVGQVDTLLSETVKEKLQDYVANISFLYHDNPFHNFEHASHVAQSANKLMQQIVTANYGLVTDEEQHKYSLGLSSDPLAQFAVVFAALIHDCDHTGVPNATLVEAKDDVALKYDNRSPAEQNSVEVAWELLMECRYQELRRCIFPNPNELHRFRLLIVNCVIATDIADAGLRDERKKRWSDVFSPEHASLLNGEGMHRKATIVIDHIIQASDIAHTMQHWSVYIKWNEKLFDELYQSYKAGSSDKDPSESWFQGEIGFFDFYIIPLAMKLKECGVFGMTSDEFLKYALENRKRWENEGNEIVEGFLKRVQR